MNFWRLSVVLYKLLKEPIPENLNYLVGLVSGGFRRDNALQDFDITADKNAGNHFDIVIDAFSWD